MIDFGLVMKRIEDLKEIEIETWELKKLGLNGYYINKALESKRLERIARGKYRVVSVYREGVASHFFYNFVDFVFKCDYEKAYEALLESSNNCITHEYDERYRIYFVLLDELLGHKDSDFRTTDRLVDIKDEDNDQYSKYFDQFYSNVLYRDYWGAFSNIKMLKTLKMKEIGDVDLDTKICLHLISGVLFDKKNNIKEGFVNSCNKVNYSNSFSTILVNVLKLLEENKYEELMKICSDGIPYIKKKQRKFINNMSQMIKTYLGLKENTLVIFDKGIDYSQCNDNCLDVLEMAIDNKDYLMAGKVIDKCIKVGSGNKYLECYKYILDDMVSCNDRNFIKHADELKEINGRDMVCKVDDDLILNLIYDRKYDEVYSLLKKMNLSGDISQKYASLLQMLEDRNDIDSLGDLFHKNCVYRKGRGYGFNRFYEAIRYKDYKEAYDMVWECEGLDKISNKDSKIFTVYRYVIASILQEFVKSREINNIQERLSNFSKKEVLSYEDVEELKKLINSKIGVSDKESEEIKILDLIDIIDTSIEKRLDDSYFDSAMENIEIIQDENYLVLYKKLIEFLKSVWEKNNRCIVNTSRDNIMKVGNHNIYHLINLKRLVMMNNFDGAYQYYLNYMGNCFDDQDREIIDVMFNYINNSNIKVKKK